MAVKKNNRIPEYVRVRPGGAWQIRVSDVDPDGKRRCQTETTSLRLKADIARRIAEIKEDIDERRRLALAPADSPEKLKNFLITEWLDKWLTGIPRPRLSQRTFEDYVDKMTTYVLPIIEDVPLVEPGPLHIQKLYSALIAAGKLWAVTKIHQVLRTSLNDAVALEIIQSNPVRKVKPPKQKPKTIEVFSIAQTQTFVKTCRRLFALEDSYVRGVKRGEQKMTTFNLRDKGLMFLLALHRSSPQRGSGSPVVRY